MPNIFIFIYHLFSVEGGVAVLPTELPPRLHPVHQRDTYTFHGGGQEPQGHYVNPQSGLLSSTYASSANQRGGPLPEPPIPVSEIGPIPPPPMFSSPSPLVNPRAVPPPPYHPPSSGASVQSAHGIDLSTSGYDGKFQNTENYYYYFVRGAFL